VFVSAEGTFVPEYQYTDHLGNLRLAFRIDSIKKQKIVLDFEQPNPDFEGDEAVKSSLRKSQGQYSGLLSQNRVVSRLIDLQAGQQISVQVKANYENTAQSNSFFGRILNRSVWQPQTPSTWENILNKGSFSVVLITPYQLDLPYQYGDFSRNSYIPQISFQVAFDLFSKQVNKVYTPTVFPQYSPESVPFEVQGLDIITPPPAAKLLYEFLDADSQVLYQKEVYLSEKALLSWESLAIGESVVADGKVRVSLVNESEQGAYFDELEIVISQKATAKIVQENHYYPFGLNMVGIEKIGKPDDKFQYNAQSEKEESIGIYETPFRGYDAQLGIFRQVDALAGLFSGISPYQFAYNNPIYFNDPTGLAVPVKDNSSTETDNSVQIASILGQLGSMGQNSSQNTSSLNKIQATEIVKNVSKKYNTQLKQLYIDSQKSHKEDYKKVEYGMIAFSSEKYKTYYGTNNVVHSVKLNYWNYSNTATVVMSAHSHPRGGTFSFPDFAHFAYHIVFERDEYGEIRGAKRAYNGFVTFVETENERFAWIIMDIEKAKTFFVPNHKNPLTVINSKAIQLDFGSKYDEYTKKSHIRGRNIVESQIVGLKLLLGSYKSSGIGFFRIKGNQLILVNE